MALKSGRQGGAGSAKDCPERGLSPYFQPLSVRLFLLRFPSDLDTFSRTLRRFWASFHERNASSDR